MLLLFHPTGEGDDIKAAVRDGVSRWLVVHVGTMLFIPLMAVAIYLLVHGIENTAARVCRIALAIFALFYTAWEVLTASRSTSAPPSRAGQDRSFSRKRKRGDGRPGTNVAVT